jgi:group I intron endonuclease
MKGIYKIINPENKIYIGLSKDIEKRFYLYKTKNCKTQKRLYDSICVYGFENHFTSILEHGDFSDEYLKEREIFYIKEYNSFSENGLNMNKGGGYIVSKRDKTNPKQLTKIKTIRFTESQMNSLTILESYNVNVNQFIRQAIKEKLQKEWKQIKEEKERIKLPF